MNVLLPLVLAEAGTQFLALDARFRGHEQETLERGR